MWLHSNETSLIKAGGQRAPELMCVCVSHGTLCFSPSLHNGRSEITLLSFIRLLGVSHKTKEIYTNSNSSDVEFLIFFDQVRFDSSVTKARLERVRVTNKVIGLAQNMALTTPALSCRIASELLC